MESPALSFKRPIRSLIICFLGWKALLLLIAFASPGLGYDTSTNLIDWNHGGKLLTNSLEKLIRWDAIYYVEVASRGYKFEQEWAFGWGFTRVIALCTTGMEKVGLHVSAGLMGVFVAHLTHLLSVLVLYQLTVAIFSYKSRSLAYTSAMLHVLSPAGLFLSTPCAESPCALLSFAGTLAFSKSFTAQGSTKNLYMLLSGLCFGIATTFRSNGVLSGLLLLEEAIRLLSSLSQVISKAHVLRLLSTGFAGILVGAGLVLPQYIAYVKYCGTNTSARPWCEKTLPSIYVFVQDHYWDNGLFKYWTLPNFPLFLLAAPMFMILFLSSNKVLSSGKKSKSGSVQVMQDKREPSANATSNTLLIPSAASQQILNNLAVQQSFLAFLTLLRAHVQIISRISSAYPVWMWYCGSLFEAQDTKHMRTLVRFMIMYAIIQAGLYASFLPPA